MGYHSGLPDNESLAAQQAAGQTDLVPPTARVAAEALAVRTVGALVKIGSDGKPADASVTDAQLLVIFDEPTARATACPAFSAGAASVAPGTLKVGKIVVASDRTLAQASALTLATTDAGERQYVEVIVRALALGYTLTIKNGGPGLGDLVVVPAALTVPRRYAFYCDGTNWAYQAYDCIDATV